MANSNSPKSKAARAASAKKAMVKRLNNPNYKQITIGGNVDIINQFIDCLDKTGKPTRIEQLKCILDTLKQ